MYEVCNRYQSRCCWFKSPWNIVSFENLMIFCETKGMLYSILQCSMVPPKSPIAPHDHPGHMGNGTQSQTYHMTMCYLCYLNPWTTSHLSLWPCSLHRQHLVETSVWYSIKGIHLATTKHLSFLSHTQHGGSVQDFNFLKRNPGRKGKSFQNLVRFQRFVNDLKVCETSLVYNWIDLLQVWLGFATTMKG